MWATVKAHNPPMRLMRTNPVAADTQNKLPRRPANNNVDCPNIKNIMHIPPPRIHVRTKGRATVQTTTRATAASPNARRRHGPYIAPTAAPA